MFSIDWNSIPKKYKYIASDANGKVYAYTDNPKLGESIWKDTNGQMIPLTNVSYPYSSWKTSLRERPVIPMSNEDLFKYFDTDPHTVSQEMTRRIFHKLFLENPTIQVN